MEGMGENNHVEFSCEMLHWGEGNSRFGHAALRTGTESKSGESASSSRILIHISIRRLPSRRIPSEDF